MKNKFLAYSVERIAYSLKLKRKILFFFISFFLLSAICYPLSAVLAESSVNIPLHHWAYDALEVLNRAGLTDGSGLSTKPITRMDAARLLQIAIERIQEDGVQFSPFDEARQKRAEDAMDRLVEEFRAELIKLGVTTVAKDDQPVKNLRYRLADPVYTETVYSDLKDAKELLYENQRGFRLKDGFNHRMRIASWIELGDFLALEVEPAAIFADNRQDFEAETFYAKLSLWNIEVEAGRDTLWWGPGYHGAMLLSDNAYPLNLVKIGSAHPFSLPWEYEQLGKWNIDFFVARLEQKREYPHTRLAGLRLEYAPCGYFNVGLSRTALFGGKGRPHLDAGDYWDIFTAFGKNELSQDPSRNLSDQKAAVDFMLNIPWYERPFAFCTNLQFYGEWAGEDKFAPWENEAPGYLAGLLISDIFKIYALDFRTEYAHNSATWYTHGLYTSGYRYKGNVFGHHMAGDADDLFMRLSKNFAESQQYFESFTLGGQFDYETHGRSSAYPERKYEAAIDSTFYLSDSKSVKLLYEREEYKNFTNISGRKTRNNIFQAEANIKF